MQEQAKLWLRPALGPLKNLVEALRSLPWPKPLQRLTARGLARLAARIPELADLLGTAPSADRPARQAPPQTGSLEDVLAMLEARDFRTRLKAVQALVHHPGDRGNAALVTALRDRSVEVAVDAAHTLASAGGDEARPTLRAVLDNPDGYYHPLVRAAAVHGLGKLAAEDELARLERAVSDSDAEVSIAAIAALVAFAPDRAREPLQRVLDDTHEFFLQVTRAAAARGLERLSPPA